MSFGNFADFADFVLAVSWLVLFLFLIMRPRFAVAPAIGALFGVMSHVWPDFPVEDRGALVLTVLLLILHLIAKEKLLARALARLKDGEDKKTKPTGDQP